MPMMKKNNSVSIGYVIVVFSFIMAIPTARLLKGKFGEEFSILNFVEDHSLAITLTMGFISLLVGVILQVRQKRK
jgi:hypothetical protein